MTPSCEVHGQPMDDVSDIRDHGPLWLCQECPEDCACHGSARISPWCEAHAGLVEPAVWGGVTEPATTLRAVAA